MEIRAEKFSIARSAVALGLAAVIVLSSVFTVAAAVQASGENEQSSDASGNFITKSEYELSSGDLMVTTNNNFNLSVDVIKANEITVVNGSETVTVMLAKGTVADALSKAGITLADNEVVVPSEDTEITPNLTITISDGYEATVTADGSTDTVYLAKGNVVNSLNNAGYNVTDDDILNVSRDSEVTYDMNIKIQRVTYKNEVSTEKIGYDTIKKNSDSVELGETSVKTKGVNGEQQVTKKVKYIDGVKSSEKVINTEVTKEPVDEVILVGTKGTSLTSVAGTFTDYNGATVAYSRVVTGSGTAYTAPAGAYTATGVPAYHGGVAVNPNVIPYGSKLYIVSTDGSYVYGYATAVDTGGALMDGSAVVDCFYNSYDECVTFGRRDVNVYIVG